MGKENPVAKAVVWAIRCCIWCLDKYVKYINKNVYIQCALQSKNFCSSAMESFYLMIRHMGKFSTMGLISGLMSMIGKGLVAGLSAWITIMAVEAKYPEVKKPIVPAVFVGVMGFYVSGIFIGIWDYASLAILHCFILDNDTQGDKAKTPESLQPFLEENDKRNAEDELKEQEKARKKGQVSNTME